MGYHIDTGLILEKLKESSECPLCEIKKIVEEQFLHEFLNDAVMEDNTRISVGKKGFCAKHFSMLFERPNKLSVALQIGTRLDKIENLFHHVGSTGAAKKTAESIEKSLSTCAICDFVEESMVKYYKTIAQMFAREPEFYKMLISCKGVCMHHYAELLKYSKSAGFVAKHYVSILSETQLRNIKRLQKELKEFCDKHDYRNAMKPLGSAETALPRVGIKFYGKENK
jgi:hypothetical protein